MTPEPGDLFLFKTWYMNHVAICLDWQIYEAWPPRVRAVEWVDFERRLDRYEGHVTILRNLDLSAPQLHLMWKRAEALVGQRYNWLANFWCDVPGMWHCWEYVATVQEYGVGVIYGNRPLARVTPRIGQEVSVENGWEVANV